MKLERKRIISVIKGALKEDIGSGDITTSVLIPKKLKVKAVITAKQKGVVAGLPVAGEVFRSINKQIKFRPLVREGARVKKNQVVARIAGDARAILLGERTALNFLGRLSGIATQAREYADKAKPSKTRIMDTRKTTPGLRYLEKYAVKAGGGYNHRMGLWDQVLIKDNHIKLTAAMGIGNIIRTARERAAKGIKLEIEVSNLAQLKEALKVRPDIIMLDNMSAANIKKAVKMRNALGRRPLLEVSGGVNLGNIKRYAQSGVDMISIGALTHSVQSLDIALKVL